ncbi:MAG: hypothetical protein J6X53_00200, partial [Abditibacteriota bacterium]|nr:hypothetical protein [Abditibacteriota bacterium]
YPMGCDIIQSVGGGWGVIQGKSERWADSSERQLLQAEREEQKVCIEVLGKGIRGGRISCNQ